MRAEFLFDIKNATHDTKHTTTLAHCHFLFIKPKGILIFQKFGGDPKILRADSVTCSIPRTQILSATVPNVVARDLCTPVQTKLSKKELCIFMFFYVLVYVTRYYIHCGTDEHGLVQRDNPSSVFSWLGLSVYDLPLFLSMSHHFPQN